TYQQRTRLRITTIGACDFSKRQRKKQRKHKDKMAKMRRRRAAGMRPQSESLSATEPWRELGMSRASWYRRNKARSKGETVLSAACLVTSEDRPVSPARGAGLSERGFASKKARGLPSSQTATTLAVDVYVTLPLEFVCRCLKIWPARHDFEVLFL